MVGPGHGFNRVIVFPTILPVAHVPVVPSPLTILLDQYRVYVKFGYEYPLELVYGYHAKLRANEFGSLFAQPVAFTN